MKDDEMQKKINMAIYGVLEVLLRLILHPKLKAVILKLLGANVGKNVKIYDVRFINLIYGFKNLEIGDNSSINTCCVFDLVSKIKIGNNCAISPGVIILTHADPGSVFESKLLKVYPRLEKEVNIKNDVWIGAGSIILAGVTIAEESVIGAGSLVNKDIPPRSLAYGMPAKVAKQLVL